MATHDYVIDNSTGANVRADINSVLQAILTNNSSSSAPSTTAAYMFWADTTSGTLKIRNSSDNAWVELLQLDGTLTLEDGSASTPGLAFRDDLNTGIYSSGDDRFNIATAGVERMELNTTSTIFNEDGADVDFRIEGDTDTNLFRLDASVDRIGIGISAPQQKLHIAVSDSGAANIAFTNSTTGSGSGDGLVIGLTGGEDGQINMQESANLKFSTADTERMRIDSSGRLGLGTSSPSSYNNIADDLVIATSSDTGITIATGTSSQGSLFFADGTSGSALVEGFVAYEHGSNFLKFGTSNTERMRIDTNGSVGIGETSPDRKLHLTGGTFPALRIENSSTSIANGTNICGLEFAHADSSAPGVCAGILANMADTSQGGLHMLFKTGTNVNLYEEKMRLDSSGRLLIGTTTGGSSTADDLTIATTANTGMTIRSGTSSNGNIFFADGTSGSSLSEGYIQYDHSGNYIRFGTANTERMRVDSTGRVLIGSGAIATPKVNSHGLDVAANNMSIVFGADSNSGVDTSTRTNNAMKDQRIGAIHYKNAEEPVGVVRVLNQNVANDISFGGGSSIFNAATSLRFFTGATNTTSSGSERMRINESGQVLVGTTGVGGGSGGVRLQHPDNGSSRFGTGITSGTKTLIQFISNGANNIVGSISVGTSSTSFNTSSDYRLKENESLISDGITRLKQLKPYRFNWKADSSTIVDGFFAHEVSSIVPESITGTKDAVAVKEDVDKGIADAIGEPIYQSIDQAKLVPLLVAAVKELITKVETLEAA